MIQSPSELSAELAEIVGGENILSDADALAAYERTTFASTNHVRVVVKPDSRSQLQQIMRVASTHRVPVYPVSRGCNWGLGSRVPICDHAIVIDLSRMNRILTFNREHAFIEIEPGVTFDQVSSFLREQKSDLFLSVIGGHPQSSIIGNTLERGDGLGPLGDRSHYVCELEAVLADGTVINTGLGNFSEASIKHCTNDPIGPALDGLFFQSNLGIITRMTVWLKKQSPEFASGLITFSSLEQLECALPALRHLQEQGIIQGNCLAIWNIHKILAATGQHPLQAKMAAGQRAPCLTEENIAQALPAGLKKVRWLVTLALYAPTPAHLKEHCRLVRRLIKPHARKLVLITPRIAGIARLLSASLSYLLRFDISRWLDAFYYRSVFQGFTSELSIRSLYWRKEGGIPATIDPDADRCGLLWLCHLIPHSPQGLREADRITSEICAAAGFEPNLALLNTSERVCRMFIALMYDRTLAEEDQRALACQMNIQAALSAAGFPCFRLGLQSMHTLAPNSAVYGETIRKLKNLFDPENIIAPGRYDFSQSGDFTSEKSKPS